jgi:penicillin-binding protein 1B
LVVLVAQKVAPKSWKVSAARIRRRRWLRIIAVACGVPALVLVAIVGYYYVVFARLVDGRLHGERERVLPRVYARPFELRRGQVLTEQQLVDRLNDLGYAQRSRAQKAGEFSIDGNAVALVPRTGDLGGRKVRAVFQRPAVAKAGGPPPAAADRLDRLEVPAGGRRDSITLDPPLLTALMSGEREKRRQVKLSTIPTHVVRAVLAIEDARFYGHPGVDPFRMAGALVSNVFGDKKYLEGGSTITQQLVKNVFLGDVLANPTERSRSAWFPALPSFVSVRRKVAEQFMALVLERRASKDEVLELYLNEVYLGQRGSFAIHGVAEGARLFFGKDVTNLTLAEAATIAGVIHSPYNLSPFTSPARARDRRNVVLAEMAQSRFVTREAAAAAAGESLVVVPRALEAEAPYFVDMVGQELAEKYPAVARSMQRIEVFTTLDLHLQRIAQDAVREGLLSVDQLLSRRKRKPAQPAQAALIAVDPRTGDILAWVGGRSYNQSQYNRVTTARRQPGSVFKPFVYLAAFEKAAEEGRTDLTPATVVPDEPTTFFFEEQAYEPRNYEDAYDGPITLRRALAHSRNVAAVKVAEMVGFDAVAGLWKKFGTGMAPKPYPSIALGAFEATPFEIASAYTVFPNLGQLRPLRAIRQINADYKEAVKPPAPATRTVARPETAYLVENMLRSVLNEGTGAAVRASGFALDAAGKTGTTNDLRDAWFVGFTPEILAVVWVGFDDNQVLGLSGSQAALPIWTSFMNRALAGHANVPLREPGGLVWAEIDRETGKLALPGCPRVMREAFVAGSEPAEHCELHKF